MIASLVLYFHFEITGARSKFTHLVDSSRVSWKDAQLSARLFYREASMIPVITITIATPMVTTIMTTITMDRERCMVEKWNTTMDIITTITIMVRVRCTVGK